MEATFGHQRAERRGAWAGGQAVAVLLLREHGVVLLLLLLLLLRVFQAQELFVFLRGIAGD